MRKSGEILTIVAEERCWAHIHLLPVDCSGCDQDTSGADAGTGEGAGAVTDAGADTGAGAVKDDQE